MRSAAQAYRAAPAADVGTDWQWRGDCQSHDPELFFAPDRRNSSAMVLQLLRAKDVCRPCQVWRPCLAAALRGREVGVWGGTDDDERAALLRAAGGDVDRALRVADRARAGAPR